MVGRSRLLWATPDHRVHSRYSRTPRIRGHSVYGYTTLRLTKKETHPCQESQSPPVPIR
jgi:hypothetical protein